MRVKCVNLNSVVCREDRDKRISVTGHAGLGRETRKALMQ